MDPSDALSKGAQIAVAFAGLTAAVVVRRGSEVHAWPAADRLRLKLLLATTLTPLILCLLGIALLAMNLSPIVVWKISSGCAAAIVAVGILFATIEFKSIDPRDRKRVEASGAIFWSISSLGIFIALVLTYNALGPGLFWLFFGFIISALFVAIAQFIRFILTRSVKLKSRKPKSAQMR